MSGKLNRITNNTAIIVPIQKAILMSVGVKGTRELIDGVNE
ncbi:hypothetical protein ACFOZY_03250 [Chungangia koreensis]|uniref:Uncharacterized protein n=1 Tax=Chungangia koreensis TaxID=752657 RepID=A0ABV8X3B8_9LACT